MLLFSVLVGAAWDGNLVSVHELLADYVLTDAGGRHQVVKLIEELYAALMVLRGSFTQLVPQDHSHTLEKIYANEIWSGKKVNTIPTEPCSHDSLP